MTEPLSPQWEDCKVCGGNHWTHDHATAATPAAPTTERDVLAAALDATYPTTGYRVSDTEADAILTALAAEGWVLVRRDNGPKGTEDRP